MPTAIPITTTVVESISTRNRAAAMDPTIAGDRQSLPVHPLLDIFTAVKWYTQSTTLIIANYVDDNTDILHSIVGDAFVYSLHGNPRFFLSTILWGTILSQSTVVLCI